MRVTAALPSQAAGTREKMLESMGYAMEVVSSQPGVVLVLSPNVKEVPSPLKQAPLPQLFFSSSPAGCPILTSILVL